MDTHNDLLFASVIIPVYNGEKFIKKCIQSLLNQDYPKDKYEIIFVDNNSTDNTIQILKNYNIKIYKEKKKDRHVHETRESPLRKVIFSSL